MGQPELMGQSLVGHALLADLASVDSDVTGLSRLGTNRQPRRACVRPRPFHLKHKATSGETSRPRHGCEWLADTVFGSAELT